MSEPRVTISRPFMGLVHMQVYAVPEATDAEILEHANAENPSGTTCGWSRVVRDGEGAPVPCGLLGSQRLHLLLSC